MDEYDRVGFLNKVTDRQVDNELRVYHLLAFLQQATLGFRVNKVYPYLTQLIRILSHFNTSLKHGTCHRERDFIAWATPLIQKALYEGGCVRDFVRANQTIRVIEQTKGRDRWALITDHSAGEVNLFTYEVSASALCMKPHGTVRIREIVEEDRIISNHPVARKMRAVSGEGAHIVFIYTELDFPFSETILPLAKASILALHVDRVVLT